MYTIPFFHRIESLASRRGGPAPSATDLSVRVANQSANVAQAASELMAGRGPSDGIVSDGNPLAGSRRQPLSREPLVFTPHPGKMSLADPTNCPVESQPTLTSQWHTGTPVHLCQCHSADLHFLHRMPISFLQRTVCNVSISSHKLATAVFKSSQCPVGWAKPNLPCAQRLAPHSAALVNLPRP
jgi:hypothetical protein